MKTLQLQNNSVSNTNHSPFFQKKRSNNFFEKSNKPFFNASPIQAKLTVNQPNDPYEKEADAMADKVVQRLSNSSISNSQNNSTPFFNKSNSVVQRKCATCEQEDKLQKREEEDTIQESSLKLQRKPIFESNAEPPDDEYNIQRKCAECEKEEKLQKKPSSPDSPTASSAVESSLNSSKGNGSPIPVTTKEQMEASFEADFSNVRLHTDSSAAHMNKELNAKAFTNGSDIYFNNCKYDTQSSQGQHLIAHELTHVVQQGHSGTLPNIQRLSNRDFGITGLDPDLAGVNNVIRFQAGSSAIPAVELPKITTQATPAARDITLNGHSSEEGSVADNTTLVNNRITTVSNKLTNKGHTGLKRNNPNPTGGEGNRNYRGMRIVEIVDTPALGVPVPTIVPSCTTVSTPCGTNFTNAAPIALTKVVNAIVALSAPNAATIAHVATFFGGNTPAAILPKLAALNSQLIVLTGAHNPATDCHLDACDGTCGQAADAYINRSVVPAKMIFCESFLNAGSDDERADTFIHESLHATHGVLTEDIAYAHTRRIRTLTDAERLRNTDSYVNLIRILHDPLATISVPPVDTISGPTTPSENTFGQRAIDFMEQWMIAAKFSTGGLYDKIHEALSSPASWNTAAVQWFHHRMHALSPLFGLTDPGLFNPFTLPVKDDKIRMAGISDRFLRMRNVLHSRTITLRKITSGAENWAPPALTVLGNTVEVKQSFFAKTNVDAIKHLIKLMLKSMPDVPSALVNPYVEAADKIRTQRSVGP
jgi:hypothetical protein